MSKLKRYFAAGQSYFITIVTYKRNPIPENLFEPLHLTIEKMANKHQIRMHAWIIIPDHIHLIVTPKENVLDQFVHDVKLSFGVTYRKSSGQSSGRLWQSRYWDHIIRDQRDMNHHIDYIHYNPVKHELVNRPYDWEYSSIHDYRLRGYYSDDWGVKEDMEFEGDYGE